MRGGVWGGERRKTVTPARSEVSVYNVRVGGWVKFEKGLNQDRVRLGRSGAWAKKVLHTPGGSIKSVKRKKDVLHP